MSQKKKAIFNWSGGKDSALALHKILNENKLEVVSLLTILNEETQRSSVHSIPRELLSEQAKSIGIPINTIILRKDLRDYDEKFLTVVNHFKKQGVSHFIFGDLQVSGAKTYRESTFNPLEIEVVEPLWGKSSEDVMDEYFASGIQTKVIVTQADKLGEYFVGKELTRELINLMPEDIDVCGEFGEYHTLSYAGGPFQTKVDFSISGISMFSWDINLDSGETKTFKYWQAEIKTQALS